MTATHITAPDGSLWQLVPVELTEEMQTAAAACWDYWQNGHVINAMWPDMLAAAPEFGGVAVAWRRRHPNGEGGWHNWIYSMLEPKRLASSEYQPLYTHPPAADEAMGRDAARYREFCRQAEERQFPTALLDDAEEMGAGVLDMHFDAAMRGTAEEDA